MSVAEPANWHAIPSLADALEEVSGFLERLESGMHVASIERESIDQEIRKLNDRDLELRNQQRTAQRMQRFLGKMLGRRTW